MNNFEEVSRKSKTECANNDFNLLLQEGNIAFYKACEVTQIFIYDKSKEKAFNYYCLFVFDELNQTDKETEYLLPKSESLNETLSLGVQRKRISIEKTRQVFEELQQGELNYDEECEISSNLVLLPKSFISNSSNKTIMLNNILKPNYWGDNYIVEFFDETKDILNITKSNRRIIDLINNKLKSLVSVKLDLSKVYDRIGNIIFQFPITLLKTEIISNRDSVNLSVNTEYHPSVTKPKNLHIEMRSQFDNIITGFSSSETSELSIRSVLKVGDDNNLQTSIFDKDSNLLLHSSELIFCNSIICNGRIGMQYSEPRTITQKDGKVKEIELFFNEDFGIRKSQQNDYFEQINKRKRNNKIIQSSGDYKIFKGNQNEDALNFIRTKLSNLSNDIKEICLWDPYLRASDIMKTLYFENTGIPFRCISSYQKAKKLNENEETINDEKKIFESFCKEQKQAFLDNSNNLRVSLKFLAQHGIYGWRFHDRFLIFIPKDNSDLPIVYSLGTSVNSLGKEHHIVQKVTNPREILNNFEELWSLLDNGECIVTEIPLRKV